MALLRSSLEPSGSIDATSINFSSFSYANRWADACQCRGVAAVQHTTRLAWKPQNIDRFHLLRGLAKGRDASLIQGLQQEALEYVCERRKADEEKSEGGLPCEDSV
jgi:hypothetical protein